MLFLFQSDFSIHCKTSRYKLFAGNFFLELTFFFKIVGNLSLNITEYIGGSRGFTSCIWSRNYNTGLPSIAFYHFWHFRKRKDLKHDTLIFNCQRYGQICSLQGVKCHRVQIYFQRFYHFTKVLIIFTWLFRFPR